MGATPAGMMRETIVVQRASMTVSPLGPATPGSWSTLLTCKARVRWGSGAERADAARSEQAVQTATFRVRANPSTRAVTARDRIFYAGMAWDIAAIATFDFVPNEIEFTATASRD